MSLGYYRALMNPATSESPELDAVLALPLNWVFVGDASVSNGITYKLVDKVDTFNDLSGNGNDFSTGGFTDIEVVDGAIQMNVSRYLLSDSATAFQFMHKGEDTSVFIGVTPIDLDLYNRGALLGDARLFSSQIGYVLFRENLVTPDDGLRNIIYRGSSSGNCDTRVTSTFFTNPTDYISVGVIFDSANYDPIAQNATVDYYKNGVFFESITDTSVPPLSTANTGRKMYLGDSGDNLAANTVGTFRGKYKRVAICNDVPNASQIATIQAWMNA